MPDSLVTVPAYTIDWSHDARRDWQAQHQRFREAMDIELIAARVTPLNLDSLDEPEEDEPAVCRQCDGRGWFWATDLHRPWRDVKEQCWSCNS